MMGSTIDHAISNNACSISPSKGPSHSVPGTSYDLLFYLKFVVVQHDCHFIRLYSRITVCRINNNPFMSTHIKDI